MRNNQKAKQEKKVPGKQLKKQDAASEPKQIFLIFQYESRMRAKGHTTAVHGVFEE